MSYASDEATLLAAGFEWSGGEQPPDERQFFRYPKTGWSVGISPFDGVPYRVLRSPSEGGGIAEDTRSLKRAITLCINP